MTDVRSAMNAELKRTVIPVLRGSGFTGSFPHFRRASRGGVDLLTFQFDRHGGGFVVEIARCPDEGYTTHGGEHIPAARIRAWDLHPNRRHRIQPRAGGGTDAWFRFDDGQCESAARQLLQALPRAELWWQDESEVSQRPAGE